MALFPPPRQVITRVPAVYDLKYPPKAEDTLSLLAVLNLALTPDSLVVDGDT